MDSPKCRENLWCGTTHCWSDLIFDGPALKPSLNGTYLVGVLEGEGVGPDIIRATLQVLSALETTGLNRFEVRLGGPIGMVSELNCGEALTESVIEFCGKVFSEGGPILAGPGGGRFVYDLRKRFDLFCKLSPLKAFDELSNANRMKPRYTRDVDILLIRENISGIYQGQWKEGSMLNEGRRADHSFSYTEKEVRRILKVAARVAQRCRGELTVVVKDAGIPTISKLWRECTIEIASEAAIKYSFVNVDHAVYRLIQHAQELDIIVAPNLFGDVLADVGGVLVGSRGLTYSGNFSSDHAAVYQTNHGAAHDLVGTDYANPVGQIFSLAMMLRESFGLLVEAHLIESAVAAVWRQGLRTPDLAEPGCHLIGTREMGERVAEMVIKLYQLGNGK